MLQHFRGQMSVSSMVKSNYALERLVTKYRISTEQTMYKALYSARIPADNRDKFAAFKLWVEISSADTTRTFDTGPQRLAV